MRIILSIFLAFFLSSCSSINENILNSKNISDVVSLVKNKFEEKIFIKKHDPLDIYAEGSLDDKDVLEYANTIWRKLALEKDEKHEENVSLWKTARVQGSTDLFSGQINITRGMLNMINDEDELACLIGHEIGHHLGKSWEKRNDNWEGKILLKALDQMDVNPRIKEEVLNQQREINAHGWGQAIESEADRIGAELAAKQGYDPYALCDLFERLSKRVNADVLYRIRKLKGSHPALDERAVSLKIYLTVKGYRPHQGRRNFEGYHKAMQRLMAMHTQESSQQVSKFQNERNDIARLQKLQKEIKEETLWGKHLATDRFVTLMSEMSQIVKRFGITKKDLLVFDKVATAHFMEEEIYQDEPFWAQQEDYTQEIKGQVNDILSYTAQISIGSIPVVGNAISLYEVLVGKDFFTNSELTPIERTISCIGVFIDNGKAWREVATAIEKESGKDILKEAKVVYENTLAETKFITHEPPHVGQKVYRIYGKDVDKNIDVKGSDPFGNSWTPINPDSLPNARGSLGLPNQNKGRFVIEGRLIDVKGIKSQAAEPLHGNLGGDKEYIIFNPEEQIKIDRVSGANKEY